jgi:hypothetical protein
MAFNHRKKKTIRRKQRFSKRKSAKTHRRRRVRIMRGGGLVVWNVKILGSYIIGENVAIFNGTFTFDDRIFSEDATEIYGTLYLRNVIDITIMFKQHKDDKTVYEVVSDNKIMLTTPENSSISLVGFIFSSIHDSTAALPPKQMYPPPLKPTKSMYAMYASSTAVPSQPFKPYTFKPSTNTRFGEKK